MAFWGHRYTRRFPTCTLREAPNCPSALWLRRRDMLPRVYWEEREEAMEQEKELLEKLAAVPEPDSQARAEAHRRWAACAKPLGGLGLLEEALEQIATLTGSADIDLSRRAVLVLCADHGVTAQGVTQTDSSVTAAVVRGLAARQTSVCRMAARTDCKVVPVDLGVVDFPPYPGVVDLRVGNGTADMTQGAAMSRAQAVQAVCAGMELVRREAEQGTKILAAGEMGIGNTTAASAVSAVLLGCPPEAVTGRGAGLSDAGLARKIDAVQRAIAVNRPDAGDPLDVLAKVGGFELAGLCGLYLGGAVYRLPVVMDGVISAAAALCAVRLCPKASGAILASHVSAEPAGQALLAALGKKPLITAGLRLGEGTGAVAALPLLDMALAVYAESYTFSGCGIEPYTPQGGI